MRLIDADTLHIAIIEKGQANERGKYIVGDIWELTGEEIGEVIDSQPTINPEPHWIPVTEPPKSDFMPYYATCRSKVDDRENWVIEGMYTKYSGWEYPPMVRDDRAEIIAWMPKELPEPYKGVTK